jgi:hypothetical protein
VSLTRGFSRQHGITYFASIGSASDLSLCGVRIYQHPGLRPCPRFSLRLPSPRKATLLRHPIACLLPDRVAHSPTKAPKGPHEIVGLASLASAWAQHNRYGNINPLSIDYACRPRLRTRLTQGGIAWPWNPWSFGGGVSHPSFATHACILTRAASTTRSPGCFTRHTTLPYPPTNVGATASAVRLSPATLSAQNHLTSELLRTLSRMAASKPTSWLSRRLHILFHLANA